MLCQECYRDIPSDLTACPRCARPEVTVPPVEAESCAWENRQSLGIFNAFGDIKYSVVVMSSLTSQRQEPRRSLNLQ